MIYFCPACYGMRQENKGFHLHFLSASYLFFLSFSITDNHIDNALLWLLLPNTPLFLYDGTLPSIRKIFTIFAVIVPSIEHLKVIQNVLLGFFLLFCG